MLSARQKDNARLSALSVEMDFERHAGQIVWAAAEQAPRGPVCEHGSKVSENAETSG